MNATGRADGASKLCFVVMAHHQPAVFQRLMRAVAGPGRDVVVHVDKKVDIAALIAPKELGVRYVPRRRLVYRSGWSQVKAIITSLEHALGVSNARHFMLLAGTDFPIRPIADLLRRLEEHAGASLVNHYPLVPGTWGYGLVERYQLADLKLLVLDSGSSLAPADPQVRRRLHQRVVELERRMDAQHGPRDTTWTRFYAGSSRWCLSRETVEFVVDFYHSDESRRLRRYLMACVNPDEIFFQTAILNSPLRKRCVGFDEQEALAIFAGQRDPLPHQRTVYLHYIDWSEDREDPAIMVGSDYSSLVASGQYFACKFTDDRSLGVIARVERELL